MLQFITEAVAAYNLPATLLLGFVVLYWLAIMVGVSDGDAGVEGSFGKGESVSGTLSSLTGGSSFSKRLGIWPVPLSIFGSGFALVWWVTNMIFNHLLERETWESSTGIVVLIFGITGAFSYGISLILFRGFRSFFRKFQGYHGENKTLVGSVGKVSSLEVTDQHGQIHVAAEGAPIVLNARTLPSATPLRQGERVVLVSQDPSGNFYYIQPLSTSLTSSL